MIDEQTRQYFLLEWLEIIDFEKATLGKFLTDPFKGKVRDSIGLKRWTSNVINGEQEYLYLKELQDLAQVTELPPFLLLINPKLLDKSQRKEVLKFAILYMLKQKRFINPKVFELLQTEHLKELDNEKNIHKREAAH